MFARSMRYALGVVYVTVIVVALSRERAALAQTSPFAPAPTSPSTHTAPSAPAAVVNSPSATSPSMTWRPPSGTAVTTSPPIAPVGAAATIPGTSGWPTAVGNPATALRGAFGGLPPAAPALSSGVTASTSTPRAPIAKVSSGTGALPNDAGQLWREYDISPYTSRVTSTARPEQAIVDWILRETGYEAWHSQPVGLLSADNRTLRVYHTAQMHRVVGELVDRFVSSEADAHAFALRIASMSSPNWRAKAEKMLHSVPTQAPEVQAWLMAKEDAALLISELKQRNDYREHGSSQLLVSNGQSTVVSATRPKNYIRNVTLKPAWPGFDQEPGQVDEGFAVEFSPLLAIDGTTVDAMVKCHIDQVDKMVPVVIDVPTAAAPRQRTQIEVPQISSVHLQERFRWPTDQVLLVSLGMVAPPAPSDPAVKIPLTGGAPKADVLLMIESKGVLAKPTPSTAGANNSSAKREAPLYNGRY